MIEDLPWWVFQPSYDSKLETTDALDWRTWITVIRTLDLGFSLLVHCQGEPCSQLKDFEGPCNEDQKLRKKKAGIWKGWNNLWARKEVWDGLAGSNVSFLNLALDGLEKKVDSSGGEGGLGTITQRNNIRLQLQLQLHFSFISSLNPSLLQWASKAFNSLTKLAFEI